MDLHIARAMRCLLVALLLSSMLAAPAYATTFRDYLARTQGDAALLDQFCQENPGTAKALDNRFSSAKEQGRIEGREQGRNDRDTAQVRLINEYIDALPSNAGMADRDAIMAATYAYAMASSEAQNLVSSERLEKLANSVERMNSPSIANLGSLGGFMDGNGNGWLMYIILAWEALYVVQALLAYGTAYRRTKRGADSGVALFGWMLVYSIVAVIPFLGVYLWSRSKNQEQAANAAAETSKGNAEEAKATDSDNESGDSASSQTEQGGEEQIGATEIR